MFRRFIIAVAAVAALGIGATDASAAWRGHGGSYHGGYGGYHGGYGGYGWGGVGAGLLAGALIGGALAAPYYYGPGPYAYEPGGGNAVAYCMRRFKSYDPGSGTYLGYDGYRHSCP
jgi:hypothetical protein